ncbi:MULTISPECIES: hypothetical protein [unclassified Nostoc]|uniref:hypothetical protein n=1 Tax=unclassified Nostoc TaxID=2593658 RepID=UPI002AD22086|nr:hypothetical protein [Nostoc sp. ChiQUE02]MDZ8231737.1 hypothetical protein [Nostoc sp. ChiQUE02]
MIIGRDYHTATEELIGAMSSDKLLPFSDRIKPSHLPSPLASRREGESFRD